MSYTWLGSGTKMNSGVANVSLCSHPRIMQPQVTAKACCELHGDMQIQGASTP